MTIKNSTKLIPALHINEHDYSPGDFVIRNTIDKQLNEYGAILKVIERDVRFVVSARI